MSAVFAEKLELARDAAERGRARLAIALGCISRPEQCQANIAESCANLDDAIEAARALLRELQEKAAKQDG